MSLTGQKISSAVLSCVFCTIQSPMGKQYIIEVKIWRGNEYNKRDEAAATYFVDKSAMLKQLIPLAESGQRTIELSNSSEKTPQEASPIIGKNSKYICITRPRRFGKTLTACMIASFFGKGVDSKSIFQHMKIASCRHFDRHINRHNVIYMSLNELPQNCKDYQSYIDRTQRLLRNDLKREYPDMEVCEEDAVWDILNAAYEIYDA